MAPVREHLLSFDNPANLFAELIAPPGFSGGTCSTSRISAKADGWQGGCARVTMSNGPVVCNGFETSWGPRVLIRGTTHMGLTKKRRRAFRWLVRFDPGFDFGGQPASAKIGGPMIWDGTGGEPGGGEGAGFLGVRGNSMRVMSKNTGNSAVPRNNDGRRITLTPYLYVPGLAGWEGSKIRGAWAWWHDPLTGQPFIVDTGRFLILQYVYDLGTASTPGWLEFWAGYADTGPRSGLRRLYISDQQWQAEVVGKNLEDRALMPTRVTNGDLMGRLTGVHFSKGSLDPWDVWWQMAHFQGGGDGEMTGGAWDTDHMEVWTFDAADDNLAQIIPDLGTVPTEPPVAGNYVGYQGTTDADGNAGANARRGNRFACRVAGTLGDFHVKARGDGASYVGRGTVYREDGTYMGRTAEATIPAAADHSWHNIGPIDNGPHTVASGEVLRVHWHNGTAGRYATLLLGSSDPAVRSGLEVTADAYADGPANPAGNPTGQYANTAALYLDIEPVPTVGQDASLAGSLRLGAAEGFPIPAIPPATGVPANYVLTDNVRDERATRPRYRHRQTGQLLRRTPGGVYLPEED